MPTSASSRSLRLWPGATAAVLVCLLSYLLPLVVPGAQLVGVLAGVAGALTIVVWWLLFSRAPWIDRVLALVAMAAAVAIVRPFLHPSILGAGMGMLVYILVVPFISVALVAWAAASRGMGDGARRVALVVTLFLAASGFALIRTGGVSGDGQSDFHWRWTLTPEERLLAQGTMPPAAAPAPAPPPSATPPATHPPAPDTAAATTSALAAATTPTPADPPVAATDIPATAPVSAEPPIAWPGFRGPRRDGVVADGSVRISTDWSATPPLEMWRRPIGPAWSSFAIQGDRVYTQEQRGDDEIVSCYRLSTGEPLWAHRDPARFYESNGGPGPRGTPALGHGRVYAFGATGILNALDAGDGAVLWSRNAATDTNRRVPGWGFASSPLVVGDLVVVAVSGHLAAYDAATGSPRWSSPTRGGGYSSPHLVTTAGIPQLVLLSGGGAVSVAPGDGTRLWEHAFDAADASIVQPLLLEGGDLLVAAGDMMGGVGIRRLSVARGDDGWTVEARWTSRGLKPYFNDFVVHEGHAYGFDGGILAAIDLRDGERRWKGGRYGHGQLLLLAAQDLLLVLSEEGELALVQASPERFTELARFDALDGKTWNHPVLVGDVLLVRNGEEMAAFRLR